MLFNSFDFLIFFPIVVLIYFIIPKKTRYIWLLLSSYYFYMCWNAKYALLIAVSTVITWLSGIVLGKLTTKKAKYVTIAVSFVSNLSILFFFKYFDFVLENINVILAYANIELLNNPFDVLLPVGISFYTFQALSYTVDVYRGDVKPEKNLLRYALFVSFFPQLVAGPIERSKNLLTQLQEIHTIKVWNYDRMAQGFIMMVWGLFQKMVLADRLSVLVDTVFESTNALGSFELIIGAVAFAFQIYCDFGGYSTIAIGAAKVMGFELMENFNTPYFATGIQDFWRRWHISLSTWFRDYLYIPLGGSRCSKFRKYCNLMITFLVSGLWHGAAWSYVVWGGLHGVFQIVEDFSKPLRVKVTEKLEVDTASFSYKFGQILVTFALTTFAWIFFRAETIGQAWTYIVRMFTKWNPWIFFDNGILRLGLDETELNILVLSLVLLLLSDILKYVKNMSVAEFLLKQCWWFRFAVLIGLILSVFVFGKYGVEFDSARFIYFDF